MSNISDKVRDEVDNALKLSKMVIILGKCESKVSIKASDPSKIKVIVRE